MQLNLFQDIQQGAQKNKKRKRKTEVQASHTAEGKDRLRIEHLNYKANIILSFEFIMLSNVFVRE